MGQPRPPPNQILKLLCSARPSKSREHLQLTAGKQTGPRSRSTNRSPASTLRERGDGLSLVTPVGEDARGLVWFQSLVPEQRTQLRCLRLLSRGNHAVIKSVLSEASWSSVQQRGNRKLLQLTNKIRRDKERQVINIKKKGQSYHYLKTICFSN